MIFISSTFKAIKKNLSFISHVLTNLECAQLSSVHHATSLSPNFPLDFQTVFLCRLSIALLVLKTLFFLVTNCHIPIGNFVSRKFLHF